MYEFQRTKNAHVHPAEDDWYTVSRHRLLVRAKMAQDRENRLYQPRDHGAISAWSFNTRIINNDGQAVCCECGKTVCYEFNSPFHD